MIQELTVEEFDLVDGGAPTWETSLWYDIGYAIGHFARGDGYALASD
jgi:hypothetical protein